MIMTEWTYDTHESCIELKVDFEDINWTASGFAAIGLPYTGDLLELTWRVKLISTDAKPAYSGQMKRDAPERCEIAVHARGACEHDSITSAKAAAEMLIVDAIADLTLKMQAALTALGEEVFRG
jgi:hypothetical protein